MSAARKLREEPGLGIGARLRSLRHMVPDDRGRPLSCRQTDTLAVRAMCALLEADPSLRITTEAVSDYAAIFGVPIGWLAANEGPEPDPEQVRAAIARARRRRAKRTDG